MKFAFYTGDATLFFQMEQEVRKYSATNHYVLRKIAEESLLVPISPQLKHRDCLYVLNAVAFSVYEGIKQGRELTEIESSIIDGFKEVTPEELHSDISLFISELLEIEAIQLTLP